MQFQELKDALLAKGEELAKRENSRDVIYIEPSAELVEGIQRYSDREIAADALSRNWRLASSVKEALNRIEDGSYGTCERCEEDISIARLNAVPWTKYCIHCQEVMEAEERTPYYKAAA